MKMWQGKSQYVKKHESDYLLRKGGKHYIHTYYGGDIEITKEYFYQLEEEGVEVK